MLPAIEKYWNKADPDLAELQQVRSQQQQELTRAKARDYNGGQTWYPKM